MGTIAKKPAASWFTSSLVARIADALFGGGTRTVNQSSKLQSGKKHCNYCSPNLVFKPRALNKGEVCENCGRTGSA